MASASTSDHHPMPMQATRSGRSHADIISSSRRSRFHRRARDALVGLPVAAADADAADALRRPTSTGAPPSIAVQRSGPAASASPSAWVMSRSCPTAPFAEVARLFEAAQTALVVQECTVWKRPPSMRSTMMICPPASVIAQEIAIPASRALSMAVAIIFFAPSWVRRLVSAMNIEWPMVVSRAGIVRQAGRGGKGACRQGLPECLIQHRREPLRLRDQRRGDRHHRLARRHHEADGLHGLGLARSGSPAACR